MEESPAYKSGRKGLGSSVVSDEGSTITETLERQESRRETARKVA
jgi:hypothetical protein